MQTIFFRLLRHDDKEAARQAVPPFGSQGNIYDVPLLCLGIA
jgi:hypothetical protein